MSVERSFCKRLVGEGSEDLAVAETDVIDLVTSTCAINLMPIAVLGATLFMKSMKEKSDKGGNTGTNTVTCKQGMLQLIFTNNVLC